jgi:flagellar motility protein MotE (MotC chaperone)
MQKILFIALFFNSVFGIQTSDKLFECTEIFKERKSELLVELERIDEQKQALGALRSATEELLKQKESKLTLQESEIDKKLSEITQKESNIKEMLTKNEAILKQISDTKMSKIAQTFAKMKPATAASVLSDMDKSEAANILHSLKPKTVGQILSKMDPKKASELTTLLSK